MSHSPAANAQATAFVEIGSGTLDRTRADGPSWESFTVDPLLSGTHTLRLAWNGDADIRFSLFEVSSGIRLPTPSGNEWTGTLDGSRQYAVSVWAAAGSADYTATLRRDDTSSTNVVTVGKGTLDSDRNLGPRYTRLGFSSRASAVHTVTVSWDSDADVKFSVFEAGGNAISPIVRGSSPGTWAGELDAGERYYIGLWSSDGRANYEATLEANPEVATRISLTSQPSDLTLTEGEDATFTVEAAGGGTFVYQWFADGSPLAGQTGSSLTVFATSAGDDGTRYNVEVGNDLETVTSDAATLTVNEVLVVGRFSQEADTTTWMLDGPAPTLDYRVGPDTDALGQTLLRVGGVLLVGGDFEGIKPRRSGPVTNRPFLAALDAVSGRPVSTFQVPSEVDSVVRALALSPDGNRVYIGGDFGLLAVNSVTGELDFATRLTDGAGRGRVFDIAVTRSHLYIGGDFSRVDDRFRANIARLSLEGRLDSSWSPNVTRGYSAGRAAPVQAVTVSPAEDIVYVGGNFTFIDGTPVPRMVSDDKTISMLALDATDGAVRPERFIPPRSEFSFALKVFDIAVTDFYVIIAWGGPNVLTFHSSSGDLLRVYYGTGDTQALQVVGDHVFVGHHGEYFSSLEDYIQSPIPPRAVQGRDPDVIVPYRLHSFRIDDPSFEPEQSWQTLGTFGVWGLSVAEDAIWITGQIFRAGSNDRPVDGLARFPAID